VPFYIIEKQDQLDKLPHLGDCFIHFITGNDNFHPKLTCINLIYIRSINEHKGYILCVDHTESFSLDLNNVYSFLWNNTNKLFVLDKKESMYFYNIWDKLYDINFISKVENLPDSNSCYNYFYYNYTNVYNVNRLLPISKHYEKYEQIFLHILPIINKAINNIYFENSIFNFNNNELTEAFWKIENNGIKIAKSEYIKYFGTKLKFPEFNISKGKIYVKYHLYSKTSRPSNIFNNINFAALVKDNGERETFIPEFDYLMEFDYTAFHPHLAAKLCNFELPKNKNLYEWLNIEKSEVFIQLYGGINEENLKHPYFAAISKWMNDIWQKNKYGVATKNRDFNWERDNIDSANKMLSYMLQSYETYYSVLTINKITDYLKNKKSKLILTTYDSFLIDYCKDDGDIKNDIQDIMEFPSKIKWGFNYNNLDCQSF